MTTLVSGLNTTIRGSFAAANGRLYFANGFDKTQVMTADVAYDAGIEGPASVIGAPTSTTAGTCTPGTHLIRYRYQDSKTGYVSNPSDAATLVVTPGNEEITYTVDGGGGIDSSGDTKCDYIVVEMTPVDSGVYYVAQLGRNAAGAIVVNIDDGTLIQGTSSTAEYGSSDTFDLFSHDPPPCCPIIVNHKGFMFMGGDVPYSISATFTHTSTDVVGTGFSTNWAGRLIQLTGSLVVYEILSATTTHITLTVAFGETTATTTALIFVKVPNRIYYSRPGEPESFYLSTWARDMLQGKADRVTAMWSRPDALYIFGNHLTDRLAFTTDPGAVTSIIFTTPGNRGAFNQRCLQEIDGKLLAWDKQGIYSVDAQPTHLSEPIHQTLLDMVDYTQASEFFMGYDPIERVVMCFFVAVGDDTPHYAACMEVETGKWWIDYFQQGITACCQVADSTGQIRLWLGDESGYCWAFSLPNVFDGVVPACPSVVTVAASSSASVINVAETLVTSPSLAGVVLYNPITLETSVIASNTASQITLATALISTPTGELWLGRIPWEVRTKWFIGQGMQTKKTPVRFYLSFVPGTATGKLQIRFYRDFSVDPVLIPGGSAYDQKNDGVSIVNGVLTIDLDGGNGDGFVSVPYTYGWKRSIQARLTSDRPDGGLEIIDMGFAVEGQEKIKDDE